VKRLRCEKCGITASESWVWIWYTKTFVGSTTKGDQRRRQGSLCPECAGEFASDRARDAFLEKALGETER
jgi:hypothetical protein